MRFYFIICLFLISIFSQPSFATGEKKLSDTIKQSDINARDKHGATLLHWPAVHGDFEDADRLLRTGIHNAQEKEGTTEELDVATPKKYIEFLDLLLKKGAYINHQNNDGKTVLHHVNFNWSVEAINKLLEESADVNVKDNSGLTALHWSCFNGDVEITNKLLEAGADVNAKHNSGLTALHWSCFNEYVEITNKLLEAGADVDAKNNSDLTALHFAAEIGNDEIVVSLMDKKADVHAQDKKGYTALHLAYLQKHTKVVDLLLLEYEDDINAKDKNGKLGD